MIYFDNAATTCPKPPEVVQAVEQALNAFGGVGRGVHGASLAAGMAVYEARDTLARFLGAPSAARVAFCSNATEALNIAISGLLRPGDRAVTTAASHNSVLRPLFRARNAGIHVDIAPIFPDGSLDYDSLAQLLQTKARLVVITHASNLTGDVYDVERIVRMARAAGAMVVLDAAQTAGVVPINQVDMDLDVVAFTGHKALYGPQGTGGICVAEHVDIPPFKVGGSGVHSYDEEHPTFMPEALEAGTLNGHGIAGLAAGVHFIEHTGIDVIAQHEQDLVAYFEQHLAHIPGITLYGGHVDAGRTGVVALNVYDIDSGVVSDFLNCEYGICTRAGAHCAPLMHKALGTQQQGVVRFSFSWFNTKDEVDVALEALAKIAEEGSEASCES